MIYWSDIKFSLFFYVHDSDKHLLVCPKMQIYRMENSVDLIRLYTAQTQNLNRIIGRGLSVSDLS